MSPPPGDAARALRGRGREDAIETIIDMDPAGAAHRVARTMDGALAAALRDRPDRITDSALFDAAHALGRYEITLDDPEIADLYGREAKRIEDVDAGEGGGAGKEAPEDAKKEAKTKSIPILPPPVDGDDEADQSSVFKEGWQERVLRHHDKIVRAKNHSHPTPPAATSGGAGSAAAPTAIPPPALIAALRQIFGTPSSPDLQNLLPEKGDNVEPDGKAGDETKSEAINTLPSLLQAIVNHDIFADDSPAPPKGPILRAPSLRRDWKSMFDVEGDGGEKKDSGTGKKYATVGGEADEEKCAPKGSAEGKSHEDPRGGQVKAPPPANLESILGKACSDACHRAGSKNSRVHGLLIAALSIVTDCLLSEEDLDKLNWGDLSDGSASPMASALSGNASMTLDSTSNATDPFTNTLQAGALLSLLPRTEEPCGATDGGDGAKDYQLDEKLLRYFVEASSTYEERIEIQKANLFKGTTPAPTVSSLLGTPPPALESVGGTISHDEGDEAHDTEEAKTSDSEGSDDFVAAPSSDPLPSLINRGRSGSSAVSSSGGDGLSSGESGDDEDEVEAAASMLLSNIADLVANGEVASSDDDDVDEDEHEFGSGREDDDANPEEDEYEGDAMLQFDIDDDSDSSQHDGEEKEADEAYNQGEEAREGGEEEEDEGHSEGGNAEEGDEDEELQRALALSLAAAIGSGDSSGGSSDESDAGSNGSAVTTDGADANASETVKTASNASSDKTPPLQTEVERAQTPKDDSTLLPQLPSSPSLSLLPKRELCSDATAGEEKEASEPPPMFEPSALSDFGKVPASYTLVHLLHAITELMQNGGAGETLGFSDSSADKSSSRFFPYGKRTPSAKDLDEEEKDKDDSTSFAPDSTTASLLIASLHMSNHLRNSSTAALNDLLSIDVDDRKDDQSIVAEDDADSNDSEDNASIQIAGSAQDDLLPPEKDDPATGESLRVATTISADSESLEAKGLKRKAAAAAEIATMRLETKNKLVEMWRGRVAFYSTCCLLNLRCLRIFMGKCLETSAVDVSISAKTRLGLLALLSNFYSSTTSASFETLGASLGCFLNEGDGTAAMNGVQDRFLVLQLCNESLFLWGAAIPYLYPDHKSRADLLDSMLVSYPISIESANSGHISNGLKSHNWFDTELQGLKLDILCKRLRVSDMLDDFVAPPMIGTEVTDLDHEDQKSSAPSLVQTGGRTPDNSLSTMSLLSAVVEKWGGYPESNLTKFYFALCQRAMSNLILWNNLSMSSNDANDHDISGGDMSAGQSSAGSWADGSLQVKANPAKFHFDPTKCADSISVAPPSGSTQPVVTANQRATKVWGTVLSTTHFPPKSGIHRWAVKLDKCERGHIFVGVSTAQANLKTYVGGDGHGWGLIGTQALWHDRNKIRGDYGSTFRTGATVVMTLDTNVGTLSFGLWKDASSDGGSVSGPLSPQALTSPRRGTAPGGVAGGPVIEDWGIAFEGLPLDVKLYPAVGLYQRDDRATLCTVSSPMPSSGKSLPIVSSGVIYHPLANNPDHQLTDDGVSSVRLWNQTLCSDGISFATEVLSRSIQLLSTDSNADKECVLLRDILPSLASSICLIPSCIPTLSAKYAMELLPLVTRCVKLIDGMVAPENSSSLGVQMVEGTWMLTCEGDTKNSDDSEGYLVSLKRDTAQDTDTNYTCYHGGSGNATEGRTGNHFSVLGAASGTHVQLIEEWASEEGDSSFEDFAQRATSTFVIDARLGLDGTKFEGIRHNVQKGTAERVLGHCQQKHSTPTAIGSSSITSQWVRTESLLSLAVGHLSLILCSQTSLSDIDRANEFTDAKPELDSLLTSSPVLSGGKLDRDGSHLRRAVDSVWERCQSAEAHPDIVEQWQDSIYFDLFSATDASPSSEGAAIAELAGRVINDQSTATAKQVGSLSRLCPEKYVAAQKAVASAILYHVHGLESGESVQPQIVSQALQASLQVMENGIREALVGADASVSRRKIGDDRCVLSIHIAEFLFDISCTSGDGQSMQVILDDIAHIYKCIKSEEDLICLKQQMNAKTEKSVMRYVGLRSLHLLLEGISVHPAIESALVSLPRLLRSSAAKGASGSGQDLASGCSTGVQICVRSCIRSLYENIGSTLAASVEQQQTSLTLGLLATYFTVFSPSECKDIVLKMLPSLGKIVSRSKDQALLASSKVVESSSEAILQIISKQENQRLLRTTASILLTTCSRLSHAPADSPTVVEPLVEHLLGEISASVGFVVDEAKMMEDSYDTSTVLSDWAAHKTTGDKIQDSQPAEANAIHSSKGLAYLFDHGTLTLKPTLSSHESSSFFYFGQLLHVLHVALNVPCFTESITKRSGALFSSLGLHDTDEAQTSIHMKGLPLKFRRRILRLLRPIYLSIEADPLMIRQLFLMAGSLSDATERGTAEICSNEELLLVQGAVSLLRYLHMFSKTWRDVIHQTAMAALGTSSSPPSIFFGILTFLGGAPGLLQPGSFVVIEPEMASSAGSTKSRGSLTGAASNATNTSTSGAEEIVSGLCRHSALSGVLSSVDHRGNCEVIVLGNKSHVQLPPSTGEDAPPPSSKVTIRAVRVSSGNVSAAHEIPLALDGDYVSGIFSPLLDVVKSGSSSVETISTTPEKEALSELKTNANDLLKCAMGLRSTAVLTSERKVLHNLVEGKSNSFRSVLAHALQMASLQTTDTPGLSLLPTIEARTWHLLSVRLAIKSRKRKLDGLSTSTLKSLLEENKPSSKDASPAPGPGSKGYRTPPSALASSFFGSERASRSSTARGTAANRREEDENASSGAAEQNADEDDQASDTAASHLREAAIVQMAELGLPRQWAELALRRVGGTNIEAAVHFCLERGGEMERLLAEESERRGASSSFVSTRRRGFGASRMGTSSLIRQLVEMGFPRHWCVEALTATRNNVDDALTWILTNGDRLSAEDEAAEEGQDEDEDNEDSDEEEEDDNVDVNDEESVDDKDDHAADNQPMAEEGKESTADLSESSGWSGVCPVRFVSGRSNIDPNTLDITGLPQGGFSSVGTKGVLLTSGKWYYEAEIKTAGCLQIGWADSSFVGHCQADRGDGCGDGPSSWAFDGWRRYRWHSTATEWGCRWAEGDIVGCLVDMDSMSVSFTLNGKGEEIGMGMAFSGEGFRPCGGVYACVSFNRREKLRLILGGKGKEPFKYCPPDGYRGIGEAIQDAVKERDMLLAEENALNGMEKSMNDDSSIAESKSYLCDFSDGEHGHELFAWMHRYYGSDASVHLGSSRPSIFGGSGGSKTPKGSPGTAKSDGPTAADIASRLSKILSKSEQPESSETQPDSYESGIRLLRDAYGKIDDELDYELKGVCASLCVLYSRKLVMHTMVTHSDKFSLCSFSPRAPGTPGGLAEQDASRLLWQVVENCTSLQSSGWVGEAGAMAIAAEALGLGISVGDSKSHSIPTGMCSLGANDDLPLLLCGGVTQILSSALSPLLSDKSLTLTTMTFAACSESAIGSDAGGSLSFIRNALQNAFGTSKPFRQVLVAAVRKAIRLLAVTEYTSSDEGPSEDDESDSGRKRSEIDEVVEVAPDARLVSFLTGVILSKPVSDQLSSSENVAVRSSLFEAWCVGLLSASSPWRMVCAFTAAGILNSCPDALSYATRIPTIAKYLGRLESIVLRRTWAERAAVPVCSKYAQSLIELLTSVKRALRICPEVSLPSCMKVDSATPLPFTPSCCSHKETPVAETSAECKSWECGEGWVVSNTGWEVWTGCVEIMEVEWKTPPRSSSRTLMDSGEGPPFLREGCTVLRGADFTGDEDGKSLYEKDKLEKEEQRRAAEKEEERKAAEQEAEEQTETDSVDPANDDIDPIDPPSHVKEEPVEPEQKEKVDKPKKKKKKTAASKLPLGTVLSIEPWEGIPAMARRVRWHLTGEEGIYRFGGDGGRFDIIHVEANDKETRVKKKHPPPESLEQCASRYGFGKRKNANVILRLRNCPLRNRQACRSDVRCDGILEWPDFGAGVRVSCTFYSDGAISITEQEVLYGSKDSGWESRFGQPSFVSGTVMVISPTHAHASTDSEDTLSAYDELLGSTSFLVKNLRNKEDGGRLRITSEMRLLRSKQSTSELEPSLSFSSSQPSPICFDSDFHASSISLSRDQRSVTCVASDGRGIAFGNVGFTKGVHYWEVKLEKAEIGSVYIGVAEKPTEASQGSSYSAGGQPRLNRWLGWGFVNFRATYTAGAERVYGAHCHAGDTVGVLLDCDAGRINYFIDGVKYGEHILNDLGCAFENVSPFGFNADGCGNGGAGQGAPSGVDGGRNGRHPANGAVRPKALWPVIGLRHPGDRVTMSSKWMTSQGVDGAAVVNNILAVDEVLCAYERPQLSMTLTASQSSRLSLPQWFVEESFHEYTRWKSGRWLRTDTRGSGPCKLSNYGLDVDLDTSPFACAAACASIGLPVAYLPGDKIDVKRSAGRILELQEEAVILGAYQGRLYYRLVSQKSEGGSLMEGGGRAWFWDECEAVDGGLQLIGDGLGHGVELPKLNRFNPPHGGLEVVYQGGAVVRSDLEIFDGSTSIGTIPCGTIIQPNEIIERRLNSCGVVRYLIDHEPVGRGWISSRIRGGKEEPIISILPSSEDEESSSAQPQYITPDDAAREWYSNYVEAIESSETLSKRRSFSESLNIETIDEFKALLEAGTIDGMSELSSDSLVAATYGRIADALPHSSEGGSSFVDCALVLSSSQPSEQKEIKSISSSIDAMVHEVATESLVHVMGKLPSTKALMARISMLRAFNRRARYGLPWLPFRSAQEGSAILGGLSGFGTSLERSGRTWDAKSRSMWVQAPSISTRLRSCRGILFTSTKKSFMDSVMDATTTPTPLSHDEYELPREVRTVRVNRLKARRAMASDDSAAKKKYSVFSQLQREMRGWSGATLRRGFVAKGHGGQKRAFKVKLVGEGVNDYSGPYREVFTDAMLEVTDIDPSGNNSLRVLDPSANNQADVGDGRDLFVFAQAPRESNAANTPQVNYDLLSSEEKSLMNSFSSLTHRKDETTREIDEAVAYLGRLVGTACRHGIPVDLPLPLGAVWKRLTEENTAAADILKEIDLLAYRNAQSEEYSTPSLPLVQVLAPQRRLLNSFAEGMSSVLPIELLSMFTGEQLRDIVCGNPEIDVELLRRVVEYEGYTEEDQVVTFFWEVLREMTTSERKLFLQFVWARNRLPLKESDFDAPFKIQKDTKAISEDGDYPLPSASTCFFSLSLPEYPKKEVLKQKLLFAIENVTTMESDYVTNDAEVSEGWRGL